MTNHEPHGIAVTHIPLDGPGVRVAGSIEGKDININALRDVLADVEADIALTDAALQNPDLADLAKSVRGAHLAINALAFHLLELHTGVHAGSVNYPDDPIEAYSGI